MTKGKVLIAAPVHPVLLQGLAAEGYECLVHADIKQEGASSLIKDCVGVVTSTRLQLDKELLDAAPLLQWIGRMGSGMEVIDLAYAASKGIRCFGSPEGNNNAVGEHALGMLLGLIRRIGWSQQEIQHGKWLREENRGTELEGKTIGIIGFGHTGRAFAKKLQGFDMHILAYDKQQQNDIPAYVTLCKHLAEIYRSADIISFHVPLQPDTLHYFDQPFSDSMQKNFILINTSRGPVIDTAVLWQSLQSGKVAGTCLDVWEQEPLEKMDNDMQQLLQKFISLPQVVITPHIAGYTKEALYKMSAILLNKIIL